MAEAELREALKTEVQGIVGDEYKYGFHDDDVAYAFKSEKGLDA
jgi:hypothetical protein